MQLSPEHVVFFHAQRATAGRRTVTIYADGTYKQHREFARTKKATVCIEKQGFSGPTRKQLDLAEQFASAALGFNSHCVIEFGPRTSPWTYDFLTDIGDEKFAAGFAGKGLKWGKKGSRASGPLRDRRKPNYEPKERK
jgi:hypothetical protein